MCYQFPSTPHLEHNIIRTHQFLRIFLGKYVMYNQMYSLIPNFLWFWFSILFEPSSSRFRTRNFQSLSIHESLISFNTTSPTLTRRNQQFLKKFWEKSLESHQKNFSPESMHVYLDKSLRKLQQFVSMNFTLIQTFDSLNRSSNRSDSKAACKTLVLANLITKF